MDTASSDNAITLNYDLSGSGSGSSDMVFYLPKSLFSGYTYVTLYSEFGNINSSNKKYASNGGFEEWFTMSSIPVHDPVHRHPRAVNPAAAWHRRRFLAQKAEKVL